MKQAIYILFLLVFGLLDCAKAQFKDDSNTVRATFTILLTSMTANATATQTSSYDLEGIVTMDKSMTLDLASYNLTNTNGYACTLANGIVFGLRSTGGIFSGKIKFGGSTSVLKAISSEVLATGFSIDATSDFSGKIEIGDGSTTLTQSLSIAQCNNKVSLITVRSGATLVVSM